MTALSPVSYHLHLAPDLSRFTFTGTLEIEVLAEAPAAVVTLNALALEVTRCEIETDGAFIPCPFSLEMEKEALHLTPPAPVSGPCRFRIRYSGEINDRMAGFYRSRYTAEGKSAFIAVTQFEESDARRAFPCFDHPREKAVFHISMDVDADLMAVSNTPVESETPIENGKKRVVFHPTPRMSTYLLFFGVGPFRTIPYPEDPRVRAVVLPGKEHVVDFGLRAGQKALSYSEAYFGIPYPIAKMDLIAVPDFAFGAMENWGAITFRENLLLYYPEVTSAAGKERIYEVIAHEIAHQWFGNLVTPSDWKYLWLNESFATYFGFGAVHDAHPDWGVWDRFLLTETAAAMARDSLHETIAIEIPGGEHVVINTSTAPIIYNKGGSILRQIQGYIGDADFQKGLRRYLSTHAYGCAESGHLWEAFEAVSSRPVSAMMENWVSQPGFPLVSVKREGPVLTLSQERFTFLENRFDGIWKIPVRVACFDPEGRVREVSVLMETEKTIVPLAENTVAFKVNTGQTGFYRTRYLDGKALEAAGELAARKAISPEDRWGLQEDLYALVMAGKAAMADYLSFLTHYAEEEACLPLAGIIQNLSSAHLILDGEGRKAVAETALPIFERILSRIGCAPTPGEPHDRSLLRDPALWQAVLMGSADATRFAGERFASAVNGEPLHPDIMKSVLQTGAFTGDRETFKWFEEGFEAAESEHERMNILAGISAFRDPECIDQALSFTLDKVPPRNQFMPVAFMAANPHAAPHLWRWYTENLSRIEAFHPLHYERVVAAVIPSAGLDAPEAVKAFFKRYMTEKTLAADAIRLSLEKLEVYDRARKRGLSGK